MSKSQDCQRAFFTSLRDYNLNRDRAGVMKLGLNANRMGNAVKRHLAEHYPECASR